MDTLPPGLLSRIFLTLPVDSRARASCVCCGWRAVLASPALWTVLKLTPDLAIKPTPALLFGAAARAAGQLRVLDILDADFGYEMYYAQESWDRMIQSNRDTLRVARLSGSSLPGNSGCLDAIASVLAAVPLLEVLEAEVAGECAELTRALRNEAPFGLLRAIKVSVWECRYKTRAELLDFAAALAAHPWVHTLAADELFCERDVIDALLDAALERKVSALTLTHCDFFVENMPALTRLLQSGSLKTLKADVGAFCISNARDSNDACALRTAFCACTLTHLTLIFQIHQYSACDKVRLLVDAVAAVPQLCFLKLTSIRPGEGYEGDYDVPYRDGESLGWPLGVLLARNLPSLHTLCVTDCMLGNSGLMALLVGLSANTHLRDLDCSYGDATGDFKCDLLDPALAAFAARTGRTTTDA